MPQSPDLWTYLLLLHHAQADTALKIDLTTKLFHLDNLQNFFCK